MIQVLQLALSVLKHIQKVEHPYHRATLPGELEMAIEQVQLALERGWQGLTEEDISACFDNVEWNKVDWCPDFTQFARAIESKLQERNT